MINTVDALGDLVTFGAIVGKTITGIFDDKISIVSSEAFFGCSNLSYVNLPNCTAIKTNAFYSCTSLKEIWLQACNSFDSSAFSQCTGLRSVYLDTDSVPFISNYVFGTDASVDFYVRSEMVDVFKNAAIWSRYATRIKPYDFANNIPL